MMAFGCDARGGTKTIELGTGHTTYSSASSKPTLGTSIGTGPSPTPSAGGGPGEGVLYGKFQRGFYRGRLGRIRHERSNVRIYLGFTQSQRIGVIIACSL